MNNNLSSLPIELEKLVPLMEEVFSGGGEFQFVSAGVSMLPLLRDRRDVVILSAPPPKLKKYDIPLCRRTDGSFVLHRVIGMNKDGYVLCGDNQTVPEYGISHGQVVALLRGFIRDGKRIECADWRCRVYGVVHTSLRPARRLWKALSWRVRRLLSGGR